MRKLILRTTATIIILVGEHLKGFRRLETLESPPDGPDSANYDLIHDSAEFIVVQT